MSRGPRAGAFWLALLSSAGLTLFAPRASVAETVPPADFFGRAAYLEVKLSPTGKYLAVTIPSPRQTVLSIIDHQKTELLRTFHTRPGHDISRFWWVDDARIVFDTVHHRSQTHAVRPAGDLFATNVDGSKKRALLGRVRDEPVAVYQLLDLLRGNRKHIVIARYDLDEGGLAGARPEALRVDVGSGRRKSLGRSPLASGTLEVDATGTLRVALGFRDGRAALLHRPSARAKWRDLSALLPPSGPFDPPQSLGFDARGVDLYLLARTETGRRGLFAIDTTAGSVRLLFDPGDFDLSKADVIWAPDGSEILGVAIVAERPQLHLFDPARPDSRLIRGLAQAFPEKRIQIESYTRSGSQALILVSSDRDPGDYYLFDLASRAARWLLPVRDAIQPEQMAAMTPVEVTARDGLLLHGYLTTPNGAEARELPLVVRVHGGLRGVRDVWSFQPEVQLLANRGFAVLQINHRGSGGYGAAFEAAGDLEWGGRVQDDIIDATRWAIDTGLADPERICLYGESLGGYTALWAAIREPDLYRCAVGSAGVYDLPLLFGEGDVPAYAGGRALLETVLGDDRTRLEARSPARHAERIRIPVLLMHGAEDRQIPVEHFHRMRRALERANAPHQTLLTDGEGHRFLKPEHRIERAETLLAFLQKHTRPRLGKRLQASPAASGAASGTAMDASRARKASSSATNSRK